MGRYIGGQIIMGVYTYEYAVSKWPKYKEAIDGYLAEKGWVNPKPVEPTTPIE